MATPRRKPPGRKRRTSAWKRRARQKFWIEHGEKLRLLLIGGGMVAALGSVALLAIR